MYSKAFKIVVLPFIYALSYLPFSVLYFFSWILYLLAYHVLQYRKSVVKQNLKNAFPDKDDATRLNIEKEFYRHFCDVIFETIKLLTLSPEAFKKRCRMDESAINLFGGYAEKKQSIIGVMGHMGNWEWAAISHQLYFNRMVTGVYHPLSNKNFDHLMFTLRSRFGGDLVSMKNLYRRLLTLEQQHTDTTVGLIADQTPPPESAYWTTFLAQDTPIFNGTEKLAKKFNYPVVYMSIHKVKRGFYQLGAELISDYPQQMADGDISVKHTKILEKNIHEQPAYWLWSHRRWKHKKPAIN